MALRELTIRNFAIIKQLEIEINDGLTVITGETGAGKSIVLGALNLLLGSRAESDMIRHQEDQCEISALFDVSKLTNVTDWLEHKDLCDPAADASQHCLIRRVVRRNKPTKCYINDQPATLSSLRELGLLLVDLHAQHEHQSLLRRETQRHIVDQFAGHDKELVEMARLAAQISRLVGELQQITQGNSDNADRMQLLAFQLNELDEANVSEGEYDELLQAQALLGNAQTLIDGIKAAEDELFHNESSNISSELGKQIHALEQLTEFDASLARPLELLNSALAQIEEAQNDLASSLTKIEQDPERLHETNQRLDTIINLARKHRCTEQELIGRHKSLKNDYQQLENQHAKPEQLQQKLTDLTSTYTKVAHIVSDNRQTVAASLSTKITEQMQNLGMRGGRLEIQIEPQFDDDVVVSENGIDQINYQVSTNQGMPLQALNRTASGGELSRISLAIQVITSEQSQTPCLVFDEVDVGVGGKVAGIIGNRLHILGKNAQVICITHLPQVAAQGDHHLAVDKVSSQDGTYTTLITLKDQMRTDEIARMLGGTEITDRTRAHAQEMLGKA